MENKYNMRLTEIQYFFFQDLDGCLANFELEAERITGKPMSYWQSSTELLTDFWNTVEQYKNPKTGYTFYEGLEWMPDGKKLWYRVKQFNPVILTGIPRGTWAVEQKIKWCKRELGNYNVICCPTELKHQEAMKHLNKSNLTNCVLVDDREKTKPIWEQHGGTYILHTSATDSIQQISNLKV